MRTVSRGKPANPVILPRSLNQEILRLEGDVGARDTIATSELPVHDVDAGDATRVDVDTTDDVLAADGAMKN